MEQVEKISLKSNQTMYKKHKQNKTYFMFTAQWELLLLVKVWLSGVQEDPSKHSITLLNLLKSPFISILVIF